MKIKITKLCKSFDEKKVLSNLSFDMESGIYLLSAPSGSGKTTLLRILAGLEKPDSGSITVDDTNRLEDIRIGDNKTFDSIRIGAMFQEDRLISHLTALENIALVLPNDSKVRDSHVKGNDMADMTDNIALQLSELGLGEVADKKVSELSGGMKRRVALARAMMYPCDLLLLDEPFTGLDEKAVDAAVDYILKHLDGRLCVIASHITNEKLSGVAQKSVIEL